MGKILSRSSQSPGLLYARPWWVKLPPFFKAGVDLGCRFGPDRSIYALNLNFAMILAEGNLPQDFSFRTYEYYQGIFKGTPQPFAFVDLDFFDENIRSFLQRAVAK